MIGVGRLHLITDVTLQDRFGHLELAALAAREQVDVVQFRHKPEADDGWRIEVASRMQAALRGSASRLVINDHPSVARAAGADGVHLGATDPSPAAARALLGRRALIGWTVNDLSQAQVSREFDLDYVGVGPVFGTRSKAAPAPTLGLDGLRAIVGALRAPAIAIGGIRVERIGELFACGIHGVAVLSAIVCAEEPSREMRRFRAAIAEAATLRAGT